ncbi:MFS transporter [Massilia sp. IC2-278]|uniref:MFS transporter n=1 Tax=Massilia sp. IC2-278 TaxID=2887200 RepID=UPI001E286320|nr:MFS transporter [Massilia sp. IC2-278]MCC2959443.1 MFS transporter [Massilia sp. IC2-278]
MKTVLLIASACLLGLLSTTGASLPYPILPPLFAGGSANALTHFLGLPPKLLFGIALMINPLGLLIGSAMLGPVSDRFGRRRLLLITAIGAAVGHGLTAMALVAQSYPLFLLARFVTGLLEGNGSIMRAMLAERLTGGLRNHALSWLNGSFNLGWLVGPLLAGLTVGPGITLPFYIAAAALLLGAGLAALALEREPVGQGHAAQAGSWWAVARERHALTLLRHGPLRTLFTVHFAYACGVAAFYEFFPLWLVDVGRYDTCQIAFVNMGMCALMTFAALFAGRASALEPRRRASAQAALAAAAILAVGFGSLWVGLVGIVLFGLPHAYYNATLQGWSADQFAAHGQGAVMGLLSTTFCLANIVMALAGGVLTLVDTRLVLIVGGLLAAWAALALRQWSGRRLELTVEAK